MTQLSGALILIAEDETLIGLDLKDTLQGAGCRTLGPFRTVQPALDMLPSHDVAAAVLDINLNGERVFALADALSVANIPFLFVSAYDPSVVPVAHRDRPFLRKPFLPAELLRELAHLIH
jgi:CheY-like chemotaxis protein